MFHIIKGGRNKKTGGQNAFFSCGNPKKYFYADLSPLPDHTNEIMIFEADKDGNVSYSIVPVFVASVSGVSTDLLLQHIKVFARSVPYGQSD